MSSPAKLSNSNRQTPYESIEVHTPEELSKLLDDPEFNKPNKLRLIEVYMPRGDAPPGLIKQAKLTAEANAKA
jgi:pyruvate decarboxylase